MGVAFAVTAAASLVALIFAGGGLRAAIFVSARVAFAPFWLAYAGGALASLGVRVFLPVRECARELGLAFAAALAVHLALVAWLIIGGVVLALRVFVIFGFAALLTSLLALLSTPAVNSKFPPRPVVVSQPRHDLHRAGLPRRFRQATISRRFRLLDRVCPLRRAGRDWHGGSIARVASLCRRTSSGNSLTDTFAFSGGADRQRWCMGRTDHP